MKKRNFLIKILILFIIFTLLPNFIKAQAKKDKDFKNFWDDEDFKKITC